MGWLAAPQALDADGNGIIVLGAVAAIVLICAGVGVNAWFRVRRIDRTTETAEPEKSAEPATPPAGQAKPVPDDLADDFAEDPDYQGPGDWDGGPLDPPEYRTQPG